MPAGNGPLKTELAVQFDDCAARVPLTQSESGILWGD